MLTTREASLRLGVSLRTVQLWVEANILPAARTPGGHRRIPYNAVEALALSTGLGGDPLTGEVREEAPLAPARPAFSGPHDVLLVAGDEAWQAQCASALEVFGSALNLRFAETGYLALLQIGQQTPDLLVTNLELPGMDGFAMLRTLERCESMAGLSVLALSALNAEEIAARGGLPPSVELFLLPVSPEALAVRVGRWLLSRRPMPGVHPE
ncbi:MAG: helix-turn-helix domain-containing protein [Rubrivivax sp.]|nr:MAG: helix-turn-helix domain-containing protein [Rubrivivax sp.]